MCDKLVPSKSHLNLQKLKAHNFNVVPFYNGSVKVKRSCLYLYIAVHILNATVMLECLIKFSVY